MTDIPDLFVEPDLLATTMPPSAMSTYELVDYAIKATNARLNTFTPAGAKLYAMSVQGSILTEAHKRDRPKGTDVQTQTDDTSPAG